VLLGLAVDAGAAPPRPSGSLRPGTIVVGLSGEGRPARQGTRSTGASRYRCSYYADDAGRATSRAIARSSVPPGDAYWRRCTDRTTGRAGALQRFVVPGAPGFSDELPVPLPPPTIATSPVTPAGTVVGMDTWMWVDRWEPVTAPLSRDGATILAIGVPKQVRWEVTGPDGRPQITVTCDGPGLPYGSAEPDGAGRQPCRHRFGRAGVHRLTATIEWEVGWVASDGSSEELGRTTSSASIDLAVHELDTVITG
jgi:hypothetical protein